MQIRRRKRIPQQGLINAKASLSHLNLLICEKDHITEKSYYKLARGTNVPSEPATCSQNDPCNYMNYCNCNVGKKSYSSRARQD
ncbi:hypothetical protein DICVIV_14173 [Dictyocaulus viviparus]|uniref:Uncharacterized protein n=1 Tax=Dictyocaulus viviparus TaxID=29172 RepID=A0A0D8X804_DICVI|nr:hypothetical protein DICVIV_14173 [Dictyocaulus viviparus]